MAPTGRALLSCCRAVLNPWLKHGKPLPGFNQISEAMFVDGKPYLAFNIRTGYLENALSKLTISSGVTLHQYSHGPVFWAEQTWPAAGIQDSDLQLRLFQRSRTVVNDSYTGPWSWFRLARSGDAILKSRPRSGGGDFCRH